MRVALIGSLVCGVLSLATPFVLSTANAQPTSADSGRHHMISYEFGVDGPSTYGFSNTVGYQYFFKALHFNGRDHALSIAVSASSAGRMASREEIRGFDSSFRWRDFTEYRYFHSYDVTVGLGALTAFTFDTTNPNTWLTARLVYAIGLSMVTSVATLSDDAESVIPTRHIIIPYFSASFGLAAKLSPSAAVSLVTTGNAMLIPNRKLPGSDKKVEWNYMKLGLGLNYFL